MTIQSALHYLTSVCGHYQGFHHLVSFLRTLNKAQYMQVQPNGHILVNVDEVLTLEEERAFIDFYTKL